MREVFGKLKLQSLEPMDYPQSLVVYDYTVETASGVKITFDFDKDKSTTILQEDGSLVFDIALSELVVDGYYFTGTTEQEDLLAQIKDSVLTYFYYECVGIFDEDYKLELISFEVDGTTIRNKVIL